MMLADPGPTPLDLRFRLFGTPVRVHPLFWLITAMLGWPSTYTGVLGNGLGDVAVWVLCAFLSILLHEFGHVWMAQLFGARGQNIVLHSMGGLAINAGARHRWQRILVLAAGPGIQLILFAVLVALIASGSVSYLIRSQPGEDVSLGQVVLQLALGDLLIMNLFWPLLNLLPIWPLDGGQITREIATGVSPEQGVVVSLWISILVSAALAANAFMVTLMKRTFIPPILGYPVGLYLGGMFLGIFFALFAVGSFQALTDAQQARRRRHYWEDEDDDLPPWRR
jgi:Zn-dependent protease